ncbi:tripartite tricarboxylate transporter TctB family protein [Cytobacillus suaedae]|nr:tripartite tricarboxylate transporter TctB family protein [Cytobacillus suaedae]
MSPSEIIYFFLIGAIVIVVIMFVWLLFRKRKKWAIALTSAVVMGYLGYYVYYPTLKVNTHEDRYERLVAYLGEYYPDREFTILPEHYEDGYTVGQFEVNNIKNPTMGVTLRVDKEGKVTQIGTWSNQEYPTQHELWQEIEFLYGETYTLNKEISEIIKRDEWIEGELTAFALTIDEIPTIALFNYSSEGYSLLELQKGDREGFVSIEEDGYVFVYIDERYQGETVTVHLKNGEEFTLNVYQNKGRLIVEK